MKKFVFLTVFCLAILSEGCASFTQAVPPKDRVILERFFQTLIYGAGFGYTLFGSKPITVMDTYSPNELSIEYAILDEGWKTWSQYGDHFPSNHFLLKKCTREDKGLCITIINKPALHQVISENLEIFQLYFEKCNPETIVQKICDSDESIFEIKSPHVQSMLGILLGYGKGNALNFQREIEIIQELNNRLSPPFIAQVESLSPTAKFFLDRLHKQDCIQKRTNPTPELLNEAKEVIDQRKSFEFCKTSFIVEQFLCPRFTCWDDNPETAQLKQTYKSTQSILRKAYANGPFLEVTLQQWVSQ